MSADESNPELRWAQYQLDQQYKWARFEKTIELFHIPAILIFAAVPIFGMAFLLEPFAGEDTTVSMSWSASVGLSVCGIPALLYWRATRRKLIKQREELERLRERAQTLEAHVGTLEHMIRESGGEPPSLGDTNDS